MLLTRKNKSKTGATPATISCLHTMDDAQPETLRGGFQRRMLEHYEDQQQVP